MISNQILQNTIDGLKTIARVDFEVLDTEGKEVATTAEVPFGGRAEAAEFVKSRDVSFLRFMTISSRNMFW